jgi:hypothetical protein
MRIIATLAAFALVAAVSGSPAALRAAAGDTTLSVAGRASSTPWVATAGRFAAVAWGARTPAGASDVYVAVSRDAGVTFGAPVMVSDGGEARLGGELPPRVALANQPQGDPDVIVVWTARAGTHTSVLSARSTDGGRTFTTATALQSAKAAGDRGWAALAVDGGGAAHALWLDHRGLVAGAGAGAHAGHGQAGSRAERRDGAATAQKSGLYYSRAGGAERALASGVCYCCKTALAVGTGGAVFAAWRHVYPGNIRDIAFMHSRDGGRSFSPPVRISEDGWQLDGCPDDGPAIVVDQANVAHIVWPTVIGGDTPEGALFYSSTRDGRTFTPRQRIPTLGSPKPSHPQIALDGTGRLYVAWDEVRKGVRGAALRALMPDAAGVATFGPVQALSDGSSAYPVLAARPKGLLAVWTSGPPDRASITVRSIP